MYKVITCFVIIIGLFPLLIFLLRKPVKNFSKQTSAIKPFLWLMFIGSIYELVFSIILKFSVSYWFTLYTLLEFLVLYYFFRNLFGDKHKKLFYFFRAFFILTWTISLFFWEKKIHLKIESYSTVIEVLFVFTGVLLWFKELFKNAEIVSLWEVPAFYFICGLTFYFAGSVFFFLLSQDIFDNTSPYWTFWVISVIPNLIMRIILIIGVWKATANKQVVYS
jgi:hypothetical protein